MEFRKPISKMFSEMEERKMLKILPEETTFLRMLIAEGMSQYRQELAQKEAQSVQDTAKVIINA